MSAKHSLLQMITAATLVGGGGSPPPPPPPPGTQPGGTWGINDGTYNRTGTIVDKSNLADQVVAYNAAFGFTNGKRFYGGLANTADQTEWKVPQTTKIYDAYDFGDGNDCSIRGGYYQGLMAEDGTCPWDQIGGAGPSLHGDQGIRIRAGLRWLVEYVSVRNCGDGIQFGYGTTDIGQLDGSGIRNSALMDMGDDGLENDQKSNIFVDRCFISATCGGVSARPGSGNFVESKDGSGKIYDIQNCLIWMKPKIYPAGVSHPGPDTWPADTPCIGTLFKMQTKLIGGLNYGVRVRFKNNIVLWDETPSFSSRGLWGSLALSKIEEMSGNILVRPNAAGGALLPSGDWRTLNPAGWSYVNGAPGQDIWNAAMTTFKAELPQLTILHDGTA